MQGEFGESRDIPFTVSFNELEWDLLHQPLADTPKVENAQRGKRQRVEDPEDPMELSWFPYSKYPILPLLNAQQVNITSQILLRFHVGKNTTFSHEDACWIHYKNNHFQLGIEMVCDADTFVSPLWVFDENMQTLLLVDNLFADVYAIRTLRELGPAAEFEEMVSIFESDSSRSKSNLKVPDSYPISPSVKVTYNRLRFESATANPERRKGKKSPAKEQEYYRLVVRLKARVPSTGALCTVLSYVSDPLIVRGQNPSRYGKYKPTNTLPETQQTTPATPTQHAPYTTSLPPPLSTQFEPFSAWDSGSDASDTLSPTQPQSTLSPTQPTHALSHPSAPTSPTTFQFHQNPPAPPPTSAWVENTQANNISYYGKVGINTSEPHEALTVAGNVFVTGTISQPSDTRVKKNIVKADTAAMLANVQKMKVYDYEWKDEWKNSAAVTRSGERGVLAQQVQEVLPEAVTNLGNVNFAGYKVENLLVVNEKALLMENIGATQELATNVTTFHSRIKRLEWIFRRAPGIFIILAVVLAVAIATVVYLLLFHKNATNNGPLVSQFPYAGKWSMGNQMSGAYFYMEVIVAYEIVLVNFNSSEFWIQGRMISLDLEAIPPRFEVNVTQASYPASSKYLFIFELDACPQFLHVAYKAQKFGYPTGFDDPKSNSYNLHHYTAQTSTGLPLLHTINQHVFCKRLGCGGGVNTSTLFMSYYSERNLLPDLIYNGDCQSPYFSAAQSCEDLTQISDVGIADLHGLTATSYDYLNGINSYASVKPVQLSHSYYVLVSKPTLRYLLALTVTAANPDQDTVYVSWAALSYSVIHPISTSPSFSCNASNYRIT